MALTVNQRKKKQRDGEREHLEAVGAKAFNMDMFRGTSDALARIKEAGGYEQDAEVLTVLIHSMDAWLDCDKSRFDELVSLESLRKMGVIAA
ncbi:hypothetical protein [Neptunomonas japonica]|uniref:hypothetical protein n=1 Tax=Neptunomonas japonica TaxID=417574 RepID=UPI0004062E89|nr:hypothetical protein [Neptunomonas japonica]